MHKRIKLRAALAGAALLPLLVAVTSCSHDTTPAASQASDTTPAASKAPAPPIGMSPDEQVKMRRQQSEQNGAPGVQPGVSGGR